MQITIRTLSDFNFYKYSVAANCEEFYCQPRQKLDLDALIAQKGGDLQRLFRCTKCKTRNYSLTIHPPPEDFTKTPMLGT